MSDRPMVSIITPTIPERHDLLLETVEHVRQQTYWNVEHIVVSDGPDAEIRALVDRRACELMAESDRQHPVDADAATIIMSRPRVVALRFYQLGRPWSPLLPIESIGVAPILTGMLLAHGEYLAWQCDDERFTTPDALSLLVDHLEATGADFAYPRVRMWWNGNSPERGWDIGTNPPQYGQFTWCLFRASLLQKAMPRFHAPRFNDWDLCERWIEAGAVPAFLPRVLVTHRADR